MVEHSNLEEEFNRTGSVTVCLSKTESRLLKRKIKLLSDIENSKSRKGLRSRLKSISGVLLSIRASLSSKNVSETFDFYILNKKYMSEVEAKDGDKAQTCFTFRKNKES